MTCAWCHEPRHRDARGRFVKAIEVCVYKRHARDSFYEAMEECARSAEFWSGVAAC